MLDEKTIKERLSGLIDEERFLHSLNVEKQAVELARHHGADEKKAAMAGLLHDAGRHFEKSGFLEAAKQMGLEPDEIETFQPKLLHSALGALIAKRDFGVTDKDILNAVENHTSGRPGMSKLEEIIYLADHIEPERDYKGIDEVRSLAYLNMDMAIAISASLMMQKLLEKDMPVHPKTLATRNFYILRTGKKARGND